ncbi:TPA: hypothetical protein PXM02_004263 [Escherichia coli]|nr:hypothetical protein [Escherichia coli]
MVQIEDELNHLCIQFYARFWFYVEIFYLLHAEAAACAGVTMKITLVVELKIDIAVSLLILEDNNFRKMVSF